MNWLIFAILGQFILGTAAVGDKLLLKKRAHDPFVYAFWLGGLGIFSIFLLPFGFLHLPSFFIFVALSSGLAFMLSLIVLYMALAKTEASVTLPFIAALVPLCTLPFSMVLIAVHITGMDMIGILLLAAGALMFFFAQRSSLQARMTFLIVSSAVLYALSSVLQKTVFEHTNFVTGFFWVKMGEVLCTLFLLAIPNIRKKIIRSRTIISGKNRLWYVANRLWAASGSVLLTVAVFLSHPALVQSTQSIRYVVIFAASWLVLKERSRGNILWLKILATMLIAAGILWLGITEYARAVPYDTHRTIIWGVTFSEKFSRRLGLDPQKNLDAILKDLHPPVIRLVAYWDDIESSRGMFDFSSLDWQLEKAKQARTRVTLTIGMRVPRWPECFVPEWAGRLSPENREASVRHYITEIIERYRDHEEIAAWQIENEPFLSFGTCPARENGFLGKEISIVHTIDPRRPVLITDSGELGEWYRAAKAGDMFGASLYRRVYAPSIGWLIGEIKYPLSPSFFRLKEKVVRFLLRDYTKPFVVIELQAEPWGEVEIPDLPLERQLSLFSPEYLKSTIEYAKQTGFGTYYLWGAEWWYELGVTYNNWTYWNEIGNLIREDG